MTEFPRSRRLFSVRISLPLSLWCRPIDGSSRMYKTPARDEPICVASLILCASPPERVADFRAKGEIIRAPRHMRKPRRDFNSFSISRATVISLSEKRKGVCEFERRRSRTWSRTRRYSCRRQLLASAVMVQLSSAALRTVPVGRGTARSTRASHAFG